VQLLFQTYRHPTDYKDDFLVTFAYKHYLIEEHYKWILYIIVKWVKSDIKGCIINYNIRQFLDRPV